MAKIHWSVYILLGLFISIFSWKRDFEKLKVFFYIGLLFMVIGAVKLIFSIGKESHKEKAHHKVSHKGRYCHSCGSLIMPHHNFCTKCGAKL